MIEPRGGRLSVQRPLVDSLESSKAGNKLALTKCRKLFQPLALLLPRTLVGKFQ